MKYLILSLCLIVVAGMADAQGFIHASKSWDRGRPVRKELARTALGFTCAISLYLLTVRYLQKVGIALPEVQLILWFATTTIGVSALSGQFFKWRKSDRVVAIGVLVGIAWLLIRV